MKAFSEGLKRGGDTNTDIYEELEKLGFFAYSGSDGDLYRKHGLGGWRISVYPSHVRIQQKGERWRGVQYWDTIKEYGENILSDNWPSSLDIDEIKRDERDLFLLGKRGDEAARSRQTESKHKGQQSHGQGPSSYEDRKEGLRRLLETLDKGLVQREVEH